MSVIELETRASEINPKSINDKRRTVEFIISTGAGIRRYDMSGEYTEVLDLSGIDASRSSIPLLDSHRQDTLERVLGRIIKVKHEPSALVATVRFAKTPAGEVAFQAVRNGDYSSVSVGYNPCKWKDRIDPETGDRVRTVLKWELHEVSLVPVPADAGAQVRSGSAMAKTPQKMANAPAPENIELVQNTQTLTRAETNQEIRALAQTFSLGTAWADRHIDNETPLDDVRQAANDAVQTRSANIPRVTVLEVHDASPGQLIERMGEAVFSRAVPSHQLSEPARPYAHMTNLDMARDCLQRANISTTGLSPADVITRAMNTTSDFPAIFADTTNRALQTAYEAAPNALKTVARQTSAPDFRKKTGIQVGKAPTLERVSEAGEYTYGSFAEASEGYAIDTFGRIISISRKAIINDDIGAFTNIAGKFGQAASEFEAQFFVDLLAKNSGNGPAMSDGNELFHEEHGNTGKSATELSIQDLSAARLAMRKQKGLSGKPINATPRYLIVAPELETHAEKILATIQPSNSSDVNPFGGKLELLVETRLPHAKRWFVVADPAQIEGLEYAYLQGEEGPQTETRAGFEVDGIEVKVRLDFGAAFLDWRGWYMSKDK